MLSGRVKRAMICNLLKLQGFAERANFFQTVLDLIAMVLVLRCKIHHCLRQAKVKQHEANLPWKMCMRPTKMIKKSENSLAAVKTLWILNAHLTLKQLIVVNKPETK